MSPNNDIWDYIIPFLSSVLLILQTNAMYLKSVVKVGLEEINE